MTNAYTTDTIIAQYCHFGWGENRFGVPNYPETCAKLAWGAKLPRNLCQAGAGVYG